MQEIAAEQMGQLLYTIDEAACVLSTSGSTVRRWIKEGILTTVRPSPFCVRISRAELERFVSEAQRGGKA